MAKTPPLGVTPFLLREVYSQASLLFVAFVAQIELGLTATVSQFDRETGWSVVGSASARLQTVDCCAP